MSFRAVASVFCCNCGKLFVTRKVLVKHISDKKKGKYSSIHYGGDYCTGNKTGLKKLVYTYDKLRTVKK